MLYLETYIDGESDLSVRTKINSNAAKIEDALTQAMIIADEKTTGTGGGTFTSGAWRTRDLNTIRLNTITGASLSSNQFTLPAGRYSIYFSAPAYRVTRHRAKIRNITDSTDVIIGSSEYVYGGFDVTSNSSTGYIEFTITSTKTFELQHYGGNTFATIGFGVESNVTTELYSQVIIKKLLS